MKIIYSFWTKPIHHSSNSIDNRFNGGWLSTKYHIYSWALSCLKSREHYDSVELYTDALGKQLLYDVLKLPFTRVYTQLEDLKDYPYYCWAIGKVYTYSIQKVPFIHIDSDVYLWSRLPSWITTARLLAQSVEVNQFYYYKALSQLNASFNKPRILDVQAKSQTLISSNAGIIGGHEISVFQDLFVLASDFITSNKNVLEELENPGLLNVIFEQLFFHNLSLERDIPITYLFGNRVPNYRELVNFGGLPNYNGYIHVYGGHQKRIEQLVEMVEMCLRFNYPNWYYRINQLLKEYNF